MVFTIGKHWTLVWLLCLEFRASISCRIFQQQSRFI